MTTKNPNYGLYSQDRLDDDYISPICPARLINLSDISEIYKNSHDNEIYARNLKKARSIIDHMIIENI